MNKVQLKAWMDALSKVCGGEGSAIYLDRNYKLGVLVLKGSDLENYELKERLSKAVGYLSADDLRVFRSSTGRVYLYVDSLVWKMKEVPGGVQWEWREKKSFIITM